jgi:betaine-aldehyde dehydrogenase
MQGDPMTASAVQVRTYGHYIDGADELLSEQVIERRNPATGELVSRFSEGTTGDVERAISAARETFDNGVWSNLTGIERSGILNRWAALAERDKDVLVEIELQEVGKPIRGALGDINGSIGLIKYAAALAVQLHGDAYTNLGPDYTGLVLREPVGVVGAVVPWNFPALVFCQKVPFALAAGCTVVVKPSEFTSGTAVELARLASEAGVPAGVVNVVTGYGDPVGQALVDSQDVDLLSFTGSTATGRKVLAGQQANFKRAAMELGGKGATVVFADSSLEEAVEGVVMGAYFASGQECGSGSRLLVEDSIAERFVSMVVERTEELRVGDLHDPATDLGALIHAKHAEKVSLYVRDASEAGARVLCGGNAVPVVDGAEPLGFEATVIDHVTPEMKLFREEVFGPVLSVTRFSSAAEAVELANDTTYGLCNAVYTRDVNKAINVGRALRSGTVWINTSIDGSPQLPYGGYKSSGIGREMGQSGLDEFTEVKALHLRTAPREPYFPKGV